MTNKRGIGRRPLADVQVSVVSEAGERHLVVAGYIESELAEAEISAVLSPAIKDGPTLTMLDLVDEFRGAYVNLQRAEAFLVAFVGNLDLVRFLSVADDSPIEVTIVHLEKDVVLGVSVVENPLQEVSLCKHRGKNKGARRRNVSVKDEIPAFANEGIFVTPPGPGVIPLRHTARRERQSQNLGLTANNFERGRAREPFGGSRGKSVGTRG